MKKTAEFFGGQITDKVYFQKRYCQNKQIVRYPSLPCVKGGAEERGGGIVKYMKSIKTIPQSLRDSSLYTREPFLFCAN